MSVVQIRQTRSTSSLLQRALLASIASHSTNTCNSQECPPDIKISQWAPSHHENRPDFEKNLKNFCRAKKLPELAKDCWVGATSSTNDDDGTCESADNEDDGDGLYEYIKMGNGRESVQQTDNATTEPPPLPPRPVETSSSFLERDTPASGNYGPTNEYSTIARRPVKNPSFLSERDTPASGNCRPTNEYSTLPRRPVKKSSSLSDASGNCRPTNECSTLPRRLVKNPSFLYKSGTPASGNYGPTNEYSTIARRPVKNPSFLSERDTPASGFSPYGLADPTHGDEGISGDPTYDVPKPIYDEKGTNKGADSISGGEDSSGEPTYDVPKPIYDEKGTNSVPIHEGADSISGGEDSSGEPIYDVPKPIYDGKRTTDWGAKLTPYGKGSGISTYGYGKGSSISTYPPSS